MTKTAIIQAQQRWEYMFLTRRSELALQDELNAVGQQGWELVAVEYYKDAKGIMGWIAFLKRPCAGPKPTGSGGEGHTEHVSGTESHHAPALSPDDVFDIKDGG
jgi:hypothetical protein